MHTDASDRSFVVGGRVDGVEQRLGELELGELGHVDALAAAKLLGDAGQLVLQLSLGFRGGIDQTAIPTKVIYLAIVLVCRTNRAHYLCTTLTSTWTCSRGFCPETAAGSDR